MKAMEKVLGGIRMSWLKVIAFAVITGVGTAAIMICPALKENAFRSIGVGFEAWFIFAIIIVANCEKPWEAGLKCFVFFLISQPLIYLVQQPFAEINLIKTYYMRWFILTLFTLPGGMIAYLIKRKDLLGSAVLGVANAYLTMTGVAEIVNFVSGKGISHIIYGLLCLAAAVIFLIRFCPGVKTKIPCSLMMLAALLFTLYIMSPGVKRTGVVVLPEGYDTVVTYSSEGDMTLKEVDRGIEVTYSKKGGNGVIVCQNEKGEEKTIRVYLEGDTLVVSEKE